MLVGKSGTSNRDRLAERYLPSAPERIVPVCGPCKVARQRHGEVAAAVVAVDVVVAVMPQSFTVFAAPHEAKIVPIAVA